MTQEEMKQWVTDKLSKPKKQLLIEILIQIKGLEELIKAKLYNQQPVELIPLTQSQEEQDKEYYDHINELFKKGLSLKQIDKSTNKKLGFTGRKYYKICRKYSWPSQNQNHVQIVTWTPQQNKEFYDKINKAIEQGYNSTTIDKYLGYKNGYCSVRYGKICKKNNWENMFKGSKKIHSDEQLDKAFYDMVNNYLIKELNFSEMDRLISKYAGYTSIKYNNICKKYNWENKAKQGVCIYE